METAFVVFQREMGTEMMLDCAQGAISKAEWGLRPTWWDELISGLMQNFVVSQCYFRIGSPPLNQPHVVIRETGSSPGLKVEMNSPVAHTARSSE